MGTFIIYDIIPFVFSIKSEKLIFGSYQIFLILLLLLGNFGGNQDLSTWAAYLSLISGQSSRGSHSQQAMSTQILSI